MHHHHFVAIIWHIAWQNCMSISLGKESVSDILGSVTPVSRSFNIQCVYKMTGWGKGGFLVSCQGAGGVTCEEEMTNLKREPKWRIVTLQPLAVLLSVPNPVRVASPSRCSDKRCRLKRWIEKRESTALSLSGLSFFNLKPFPFECLLREVEYHLIPSFLERGQNVSAADRSKNWATNGANTAAACHSLCLSAPHVPSATKDSFWSQAEERKYAARKNGYL